MIITSTKSVCTWVKCLVYGESGIGKTVLGSTAPKPIIISAERGLLSLADKDIPVIEVNGLTDVLKAYNFLHDNAEFETIVLDSLSEIGEQLLEQFKKEEKDPRKAYGRMADELYHMTKKFRDLDKHVVFIAKQELNKDEFTGKVSYRPSTPGQSFTSQVPYFFDEVFCMRIGKVGKDDFRYLQTQPDIQYTAKDRSGKLEKSENPNLSAIFEKIKGA